MTASVSCSRDCWSPITHGNACSADPVAGLARGRHEFGEPGLTEAIHHLISLGRACERDASEAPTSRETELRYPATDRDSSMGRGGRPRKISGRPRQKLEASEAVVRDGLLASSVAIGLDVIGESPRCAIAWSRAKR